MQCGLSIVCLRLFRGHTCVCPTCWMPVSRFECVSGLSVYWPIIALGTRECGVAKLCRDPTVQSEFFVRVSLLKTFTLIYCYR